MIRDGSLLRRPWNAAARKIMKFLRFLLHTAGQAWYTKFVPILVK